MGIIASNQLEIYCQDAVTNAQNYNAYYGTAFELMYKIGCRWNEVYDLTRWSFSETYGWQLQPAKGNNLRTQINADLPAAWISILEGSMEKFDYCRYASFSRSFHSLFPVYPLYLGSKDVTSHVFRYNKFRQLYEVQGWTIQQIKDYTGEIDTRNVTTYLNSKINK